MSVAELSVLIAEDHDFQRSVVVRMLKKLGVAAVHEAGDGQKALEVVRTRSNAVDIALVDLDMPGMDGMEFLRHIGTSDARLSVIITSALDQSLLGSVETMAKAYGISLLGVLHKPVTPERLASLIGMHQPEPAKSARSSSNRPAYSLDEILDGLKRNEFEPFYQPKIDTETGFIKGAEALARWRHPQHGFVAPFAFISTLEDNGLIDPLTWTILRKSAAFCKAWRATGADVTVSVNLSLKSLVDPGLADRITGIVKDQGLDPRHLVLELTESAATTDVGSSLENLARLRMKGFGLSIDDYGTGYSSMQQLARVAFTELKIDQSFVTGASARDSAMIMLESTLDMARKMKLSAVAEGVETQEDLDLLRVLRCDLAQGYYIARPMEGTGFLDWTRTWKM